MCLALHFDLHFIMDLDLDRELDVDLNLNTGVDLTWIRKNIDLLCGFGYICNWCMSVICIWMLILIWIGFWFAFRLVCCFWFRLISGNGFGDVESDLEFEHGL